MSTDYNVFQQVFSLSFASNLVGDCEDWASGLEKKLVKVLPDALKKAGPGWELVWGPAVWKSGIDLPFTKQSNAWYIAKNNAVRFEDGIVRPAYVIAIAGSSGLYDYLVEDDDIGRVVSLDKWFHIYSEPEHMPNKKVPADEAVISNGFAQAVYRLLGTKPHADSGSLAHQFRLPDFLQVLSNSPSDPATRLIITGHSLGGSLAPSLAYMLVKSQVLGPIAPENVFVYPTAGPSPGNLAFAKRFNEQFPSPKSSLTGYQHWNVNIVNRSDVVPCAFCTDPSYTTEVLSHILTMFGDPGFIIKAAVGKLITKAAGLYFPIKSSYFNSKFPIPAGKFKWGDEAHTQHILAYNWAILNEDPPEGVCGASKQEQMSGYPVLGAIVAAQQAAKRVNQALKEVGSANLLEEDV